MKRKRKWLILVCLISLLPMKDAIGQADQRKRRDLSPYNRLTDNPYRPANRRHSSVFIWSDDRQQYAPNEVIVKFKVPLSDFELAYLFGEFQPTDTKGLPTNWGIIERSSDGRCRIRIPEGSSLEGILQRFERNPMVERAEPNHIVRAAVVDPSASFKEKIS